jgi:hypothetical protein
MSINVKINSERPDFRIFGTYFFGNDLYDYDSDGNSIPVTSKNWTKLYMCCRENSNMWFEIEKINDAPCIFKVTSDTEQFTCRIAYFLAIETQGEILTDNYDKQNLSELTEKMGNFDLNAHLLLAKNSIWRKATENNPYPNLTI